MIYINSYPRSGNNYAQAACRMFLSEDFEIRHHPDLLNTGINQIVILRSPFEAVASNVERFALADPEITVFETGIPVEEEADKYINKYIKINLEVYAMFLDQLENVDNSTLIVNFNHIIEDPKSFIQYVSNFFDCNIVNSEKLSEAKEILHSYMTKDYQYFYPKKTTHPYRQIANRLIHQHPKADELYKRYINILVNQNII